MYNLSSNHVYYQFMVCKSGFIHTMSLGALVDNTDLALFQRKENHLIRDLVYVYKLMLNMFIFYFRMCLIS